MARAGPQQFAGGGVHQPDAPLLVDDQDPRAHALDDEGIEFVQVVDVDLSAGGQPFRRLEATVEDMGEDGDHEISGPQQPRLGETIPWPLAGELGVDLDRHDAGGGEGGEQ